MGWDTVSNVSKNNVKSTIAKHFPEGTMFRKVAGEDALFAYYAPTICVVLYEYDAESKTLCYKVMTESEGPYVKGCPKAFLDAAPVTNPEWRKRQR